MKIVCFFDLKIRNHQYKNMMAIAPQVDYKKIAQDVPDYSFSMIPNQEGQQSITISGSGGDQLTYIMPSAVFNFARSYITMTITPSAGAAGIINHIFKNLVPFRQILLLSGTGSTLADYNNASYQSHMLMLANTKSSDLMNAGDTSVTNYQGPVVMSNSLTSANYRPGNTSTTASINYFEPAYEIDRIS